MLALHGTVEDIARLEAALESCGGDGRAAILAELSWYLRDRDTVRAAALAEEAARSRDPAVRARADLMRGHCAMVRAELPLARRLLDQSLKAFQALGDRRGEADLRLVETDFAQAVGDTARRMDQIERAEPIYRELGFEPGLVNAGIRRAHIYSQIGRVREGRELALDCLARAERLGDAAGQSLALFVLGCSAIERGEHNDAMAFLSRGLELAHEESLRFAEAACQATLAVACSRMGDQAGYLYWLDLAHASYAFLGRTQQIAYVLNSLGFLYTQLAEHGRARGYLDEAHALLRGQENTRTFALNRRYAGDLALALGDAAAAAETYRTGWLTAARLLQVDLQITCLRGLGIALSRLGQAEEARDALEQALTLSEETQSRVEGEIDTLRALAELYRSHRLSLPCGLGHASPAVAYLERALAVARGMDGYRIRPELHEELATAYEEAGDVMAALAQQRAALAASRAIFTAEADSRLRALQARLEMDRVRAVADAERARAEELEAGARTIALLGEIGQRITASLDAEQVFETLRANIGALLDTPVFGIALLRQEQKRIDFPYFVENGVRVETDSLPLDHPTSVAARCLREGREVLLVSPEQVRGAPITPGTSIDDPQTVLFHPLTANGRMLGVMTCQSYRPDAYSARDRDIVRTLASYGAVALANAEAFQALDRALTELRDAQALLVEREKMAALGQVVAGIAHEVNTPVGIALSAATGLGDAIRRVEERLAAGALRRSDLEELLADGREAAAMVERNARRASQLISSFKEVAVDQTSDQRRQFDLAAYLDEVVTSLGPRIRRSLSRVEIAAEPPLAVDSYPGAIAQIVTNLVINALDHGFTPGQGGTIRISARARPQGMVELAVSDDGRGFAADALARLFEPFFTTRRAAGNTGLGLHVAFNLAGGRLGGTLRAESPGGGARFVLSFPAVAPDRDPAAAPEPALTES
ncbi:MAG TPA: ATP-binding protein [Azospirillaceae bacterium]|nr:ATP-binding protein [Azospirillaceae bacterium]